MGKPGNPERTPTNDNTTFPLNTGALLSLFLTTCVHQDSALFCRKSFGGYLLVNIFVKRLLIPCREDTMFAVGHLAIGYLSAKVFQKILKTDFNLPMIFFLSLIPDVDLLIPGLVHRGITHSIIVLTLMFIPIFLFYRKNSVPYFVAIVQHSLVGDFFMGRAQIFWPLTSIFYGGGIDMLSFMNISIECVSFLLAIIILTKTNDLRLLFKSQKPNLLLTVPSGAIFVSSIIGMSKRPPTELLIPHLVFLVIFTISIMRFLLKKLGEKGDGTRKIMGI